MEVQGRANIFAKSERMFYPSLMSATEIIEQFKALPASERAQVAKFVVEHDDSWLPESFKQGMADAEAGRFADMETVLSGAKPPSRAAE
jgi:predicted transcriptional regulator